MASGARLLKTGRHLLGWAQTGKTRSRICQTCHHSHIRKFTSSVPVAGVFEPDGLKLEPDIPEYTSLNLRIRGYDFVSVESYTKHVHRMADGLEMNTHVWAVPACSHEIRTFKPSSSVVDNKYNLKLYERTVQLNKVPSPDLLILLEMMRTHAPEGIYVTVKEPDEAEEEFRYVPDKEMQQLKSQMKEIEDAKEERRKK